MAGERHRKKKDYDRVNYNGSKTVIFSNLEGLKAPECEIFDRSDFTDFYTIKSLKVDESAQLSNVV